MDALENLGYKKYPYANIMYIGNGKQITFVSICGKYELYATVEDEYDAPNLTHEEVLACAEVMKELNNK